MENDLVVELTGSLVRNAKRLTIAGWHDRRGTTVITRVGGWLIRCIRQTGPTSLGSVRPIGEKIAGFILAGWAAGNSVDHAFATAWDQGIMLGARRSWWRIAAEIEEQMLRPAVPVSKQRRAPRNKPVLKATGPEQVWRRDITDLYSPWRGGVQGIQDH
ncbi:MAG: hypothetical protein R2722_01255 [Tessaracoccus sp.]